MSTTFMACPRCAGRLMVASVQRIVGCHHCGQGCHVVVEQDRRFLHELGAVFEENQWLRERVSDLMERLQQQTEVPVHVDVPVIDYDGGRHTGMPARILVAVGIGLFGLVFTTVALFGSQPLLGTISALVTVAGVVQTFLGHDLRSMVPDHEVI